MSERILIDLGDLSDDELRVIAIAAVDLIAEREEKPSIVVLKEWLEGASLVIESGFGGATPDGCPP